LCASAPSSSAEAVQEMATVLCAAGHRSPVIAECVGKEERRVRPRLAQTDLGLLVQKGRSVCSWCKAVAPRERGRAFTDSVLCRVSRNARNAGRASCAGADVLAKIESFRRPRAPREDRTPVSACASRRSVRCPFGARRPSWARTSSSHSRWPGISPTARFATLRASASSLRGSVRAANGRSCALNRRCLRRPRRS
jgi:hypothetical protein